MQYSKEANQTKYPFILPELPYSKDDFKPHFTAETFDYHHGKHHQTYVTNLNKLLETNKELATKNLEDVIKISFGNATLTGVFNNAAQIWNHTFFWHSIKPSGGGTPRGKILDLINRDFGNFESFATEFKQAAITQFGSGWAWLVFHDGKLQILKTANAETPIAKGIKPLLACDVWEHAYYIDYRNNRANYVDIYINHMINWEFAESNL
jgi:Fe-Mn family superoxide dismutase